MQKSGQSKLPRPAFCAVLSEFKVLFQVIGNGREVHCLVGLCQPDGIYLSQPHELGQGAENGFHGTLSFALHVPALWTLHPCDVAFVFFAIVRYAELLLLCRLAQALLPYGTA